MCTSGAQNGCLYSFIRVLCVFINFCLCEQEVMVRFPLKEVQSTRTLRPTSGSSYPYVDIMIGDLLNQRITQLQLEQVFVWVCVCL